MKRSIMITVTAFILVAILLATSVVMAAKRHEAIEMTNGMPGGEHETLLT